MFHFSPTGSKTPKLKKTMEINTFTKLDKVEFGCQLTHSISNLTQLHFSSDASAAARAGRPDHHRPRASDRVRDRAMVSWRDAPAARWLSAFLLRLQAFGYVNRTSLAYYSVGSGGGRFWRRAYRPISHSRRGLKAL
jgi:hypothetical protein